MEDSYLTVQRFKHTAKGRSTVSRYTLAGHTHVRRRIDNRVRGSEEVVHYGRKRLGLKRFALKCLRTCVCGWFPVCVQ